MSAAKNSAALPTQNVSFGDLYAQHFTPNSDAVREPCQVQASTQFKIFSLNDSHVNIVYSNQAGK